MASRKDLLFLRFGEMIILFEGMFRVSGEVRRTADPSATPDFLSRVVTSIKCMWFSLRRTTYVVAG
jgi:hypothetical protein